MLDVEAVNWSQLRKYDIFQQMLRAAASSPTSQVRSKTGSLSALTPVVCLGARVNANCKCKCKDDSGIGAHFITAAWHAEVIINHRAGHKAKLPVSIVIASQGCYGSFSSTTTSASTAACCRLVIQCRQDAVIPSLECHYCYHSTDHVEAHSWFNPLSVESVLSADHAFCSI